MAFRCINEIEKYLDVMMTLIRKTWPNELMETSPIQLVKMQPSQLMKINNECIDHTHWKAQKKKKRRVIYWVIHIFKNDEDICVKKV